MPRPLIIDSFAGGGGASEGIRAAIGRDPDFALNHDAIALAMHRINQPADEPLHTVTAKPRHGLVTVTVNGQPYAIVDIGMRMLTPRERFNAQGFRPDYVIDRGELEDGSQIALTLEQQGRACGNSVCPQVAQAIVAANYREDEMRPRRPAAAADMPLFPLAAAE